MKIFQYFSFRIFLMATVFYQSLDIFITQYFSAKRDCLCSFVFRLVAYLLNMICLILQLLYKILYEFSYKFYPAVYQLLAWDSQVSFYTLFHISFTVPLSKKMKENTYLLLRLESEYEYLLIRTIIRNIRHCCESDTVLPTPSTMHFLRLKMSEIA